MAGGRQCGRLHNIGSHLLITALMSSRTSCQKSDKIRQKSAPMSSGSSCQKSDKDQPPCPLGLVVKNQTLKVRPWNSKQRIWRWCQQRGILLKSPQQGIYLVSKYNVTCLINKIQKRRNAEFYNSATTVNRGSRCQRLVASFFTTTSLVALTKVVCLTIFHTLQRTNQDLSNNFR